MACGGYSADGCAATAGRGRLRSDASGGLEQRGSALRPPRRTRSFEEGTKDAGAHVRRVGRAERLSAAGQRRAVRQIPLHVLQQALGPGLQVHRGLGQRMHVRDATLPVRSRHEGARCCGQEQPPHGLYRYRSRLLTVPVGVRRQLLGARETCELPSLCSFKNGLDSPWRNTLEKPVLL